MSPRALGYKGTLHGQPLRKILRVDRSPMNDKVKVYGLECGHDVYATGGWRAARKTVPCDKCPAEQPTRPTGPEDWRPVVGYEGIYSVSSLGNVRNEKRPDYMLHQPVMSKTGYVGVRLYHNKVGKTGMIATLVTAAFIGPKPAGQFINHKDGNKHNNSAANLEYVTKRQNEDHAVEHALHAWGETHGMRKLDNEKVREIRASRESDDKLAARYHVAPTTINNVRAGRTWRHLP